MISDMKRRSFIGMVTKSAVALAILASRAPFADERVRKPMKYRGVVYDVGLRFTAGQPYSIEPFNSNLVKHDLNVMANDLHANTVRIEGEELSRLAFAAGEAHAAGLKIFFNPWKMNVHVSELIEYFSSAAEIAETLRLEGLDIIFVSGCEISLFNEGIFPGANSSERLTWRTSSGSNSVLSSSPAAFAKQFGLLNSTLTKAVDAIRSKFKGSITYSAGTWEAVDMEHI